MSNILKTKPSKLPRGERQKEGWQAKKSAMTREAILEAAIHCIIDVGYAQTTTSLIADHANVSRGAMTHHFPSRASVLTATIEYLHDRRLQEYKALVKEFDVGSKLTAREQIETVVNMVWKFVTLSSSTAYQEILMASRTDPELKRALEPLEKEFEEALLALVKGLFPRWEAWNSPSAAMTLLRRSRSASACLAMARCISCGRSICFTSTLDTFTPHGSVLVSMICCSL